MAPVLMPDKRNLDRPAQLLSTERASALARMNDLTAQLEGLIAAAESSNLDDEHDPEGATIAFEREQLSALRDQARARVEQIDAALRRVASGSYGLCEQCGASIPPERLAARPAVSECVRCASRRR